MTFKRAGPTRQIGKEHWRWFKKGFIDDRETSLRAAYISHRDALRETDRYSTLFLLSVSCLLLWQQQQQHGRRQPPVLYLPPPLRLLLLPIVLHKKTLDSKQRRVWKKPTFRHYILEARLKMVWEFAFQIISWGVQRTWRPFLKINSLLEIPKKNANMIDWSWHDSRKIRAHLCLIWTLSFQPSSASGLPKISFLWTGRRLDRVSKQADKQIHIAMVR